MKKFLLALAMAATFALPSAAQTDFRHITFDEALAAAKAEGKKVFVDFYTTWCGPCRRMANEVFPQKQVGDFFNAKFVNLKLDAEKEGKELAAKCNVAAYPTFIIFDAEGNEIGRILGGGEPEEFMNRVDVIADPNKSPENLKKRYEAGEHTAEVVSAYSGYLIEKAYEDNNNPKIELAEKADSIVAKYYATLSDADKLKKENFFVFQSFLIDSNSERAQFLFNNKNKFDASLATAVDKKIEMLLGSPLYFILVGRQQDLSGWDNLKAKLKLVGFDTRYAHMIKLVDTKIAGEPNTVVDYFKANFANFDSVSRTWTLAGMPTLISDGDAALKTDMIKYLRSLLPEMATEDIFSAANAIRMLESTVK